MEKMLICSGQREIEDGSRSIQSQLSASVTWAWEAWTWLCSKMLENWYSIPISKLRTEKLGVSQIDRKGEETITTGKKLSNGILEDGNLDTCPWFHHPPNSFSLGMPAEVGQLAGPWRYYEAAGSFKEEETPFRVECLMLMEARD